MSHAMKPQADAAGKPKADEHTPLVEDEDNPELWGCLAVSEPYSSRYKADNPTPAYLVATNLATIVTQSMMIFTGYLFLTANASKIFPLCTRRGRDEGDPMYWLCIVSGLGLWTFPLICQCLIPILNYLVFCDTRLYYECLREKTLIQFSSRSFFQSYTFYFVSIYLTLGLLFVIASAFLRGDPVRLKNTFRGLGPFMFPTLNFFITMYNWWDLKYFLVTLSNFVSADLKWSQKHISECIEIRPFQAAKAVKEMQSNGKWKELEGQTSREVFQALYDKCAADAPESLSTQASQEQLLFKAKQDLHRMKALFLGQKGFWITDLLWLPQDTRAKQFKMAFRFMQCVLPVMELILLWLIVCTSAEYLTRQDLINAPEWMRLGFMEMETASVEDEVALYKWLSGNNVHAK